MLARVFVMQVIKQDSETVGAVAVDSEGRLAAATSTGGRTCKVEGRIGDTPINGAGGWGSTGRSCPPSLDYKSTLINSL